MTRPCADEEMVGPPSPLPHSNSGFGDQRNHPSLHVSCRLPAELLASIFIHIARDSCTDEQCHYFNPTGPSWVNVSYVCRYWRDVALNCPTFWSYIPATSQRWTQELLARSQMVPLKISTKVPTVLSNTIQVATRQGMKVRALSIIEKVMNHSQRIQKLYFTDPSILSQDAGYQYQALSKFLFTHLPCLQHLEISDFNVAERKSMLLCEENTPALRTLRLNRCWMPWHAIGPSFLTTLHLSSVRNPIHENTMASFLAMLRRMPHLVQLCVDSGGLPNALDFLSNGELLATPVINLPHLSNISIVMTSVSTAIALLSCVKVPLKTKVYLKCTHYATTLDDYVRLASLLGQRFSQPDSPKFRSLTIGSRKRLALAFSTSERVEYHSPDSFFRIGSDDSALLKVSFCPTHTPMDALDHRVWNGICSQIPLTNIQSVHSLESSLEPEFWRGMLASLSDVRYIRFSHDQMPDITSMLSLSSHLLTRNWQDGRADRGQSEIFVPALEELELYQTTLERVRGRSRSDPNPCVAGLEDLYDAIATRKETRCQLTIKECRLVTDKGIKALESRVGWWEGDQFRVTSHV